MVKYTEEPGPVKDERTLVKRGKLYHAETDKVCTTCLAGERFMCVKQKHASGDVTLECPWCETTLTVSGVMIRDERTKK